MSMVAGSLAEFFHVVTVDLRNHGESFHHSSMTYLDMAGDLVKFMDERKIESAALVGHSMGGKCTMQAALSFPDRVKKIAVVDIAPRTYTPDWESYLEAMLCLNLDQIRSRLDADRYLSKCIPERVYRQFLLQNLVHTDENRFKWRSNLNALLNSKYDICASVMGEAISKEALFIKGGSSKFIQNADTECILSLFPCAKITTVSGVGHLVHFEAREVFTAILIDFLKGN